MEVEIINQSRRQIEIKKGEIVQLIIDELKTNNRLDASTVEIILVGKKRIQELNKEYRRIDEPTDVLSFSVDLPKLNNKSKKSLGTIFLCPEIIESQALEHDNTFKYEFEMLARHGLKHLIGIHHEEENI